MGGIVAEAALQHGLSRRGLPVKALFNLIFGRVRLGADCDETAAF